MIRWLTVYVTEDVNTVSAWHRESAELFDVYVLYYIRDLLGSVLLVLFFISSVPPTSVVFSMNEWYASVSLLFPYFFVLFPLCSSSH